MAKIAPIFSILDKILQLFPDWKMFSHFSRFSSACENRVYNTLINGILDQNINTYRCEWVVQIVGIFEGLRKSVLNGGRENTSGDGGDSSRSGSHSSLEAQGQVASGGDQTTFHGL